MYKKLIENKKVVFFDLDGTLVDTRDVFLGATIDTLEELGYTVDEDLLETTLPPGISGKEAFNALRKIVDKGNNGQELSYQTFINTYKDKYISLLDEYELEPIEGFWDLAFKLKAELGLKLGLVTNTPKDRAQHTMERIHVDNVFDVTVFGDEVKHRKPSPEIYKRALKLAGAKPKEALAFEDSVIGSQASVKAGIDTVVIWDTTTPQTKYPNKIRGYIPDFDYLVDNLDTTLEETLNALNESTQNSDNEDQD